MKRLYILFAVLMCSATVFAADPAETMLKELSAKLKSYKSYEVKFTVSAKGEFADMSGNYIVSGDKYYINTSNVEIVCDGKAKYEIDNIGKEISIDKVNLKDRNILSNPTRAFDFLDGTFAYSAKGDKAVNGKMCGSIALTPKDNKMSFKSVQLFLDKQTNLPVMMSYTIDGMDSPIEISIKEFNVQPQVSDSQFTVDKSKYKNYETIDFR